MPDHPQPPDAGTVRLSDDGRWWWDGHQWKSAISDDGLWRWDGAQWQAIGSQVTLPRSATLLVSHESLSVKGINSLCASPDGRRLAWVEELGQQECVVLDRRRLKAYDEVKSGESNFVFSPDGRRFAYSALNSNREHLVIVDDQEAGPYERSADIIFSPDCSHVAYMAKQGGKWRVVRDGTPGKQFDNMYPPNFRFSADSSHLAYLASMGKQHLLVVDEIERQVDCDHWLASSLAVSADGGHIAVGINRKKKDLVMVDGVEQGPYESLLDGPVLFSPTRSKLVYAVKNAGRAFVVLDGQAQPAYDSIASSPESIIWSAVGERLAYVGGRGQTSVVVVDGSEWSPCSGVRTLLFSPDGERLAAVQSLGKLWAVVVDGVAAKPYAGISYLAFSQDGRHLAYMANLQSGGHAVVVDGHEMALEGFGIISPGIVFDPGDAFHYIEGRSDGSYLVERSLT